jgi:hypothetical protein
VNRLADIVNRLKLRLLGTNLFSDGTDTLKRTGAEGLKQISYLGLENNYDGKRAYLEYDRQNELYARQIKQHRNGVKCNANKYTDKKRTRLSALEKAENKIEQQGENYYINGIGNDLNRGAPTEDLLGIVKKIRKAIGYRSRK